MANQRWATTFGIYLRHASRELLDPHPLCTLLGAPDLGSGRSMPTALSCLGTPPRGGHAVRG